MIVIRLKYLTYDVQIREWNHPRDMDKLSRPRRSDNMRKIRSKDTSPEMFIRRLISQLGYRYRLHVRELPGKPDLVFRRLKCIIFVHGCFWHLHPGCREGRIPSSRPEYWKPKLTRNVERDRANIKQLIQDGWRVLVIWECECETDQAGVQGRICDFLSGTTGSDHQCAQSKTVKE
jgi:DNA mismatch endonuclease, patch repair protein